MSEQLLELSPRRIHRIGIGIAIVAAAGVALRFGWRDAVGFALGASISLVNLRSWMRLVDRLAEGKGGAGGGFRYLLMGAGAYVIFKVSGASAAAILAGLLTAVAAVLCELIGEVFRNLFYARI